MDRRENKSAVACERGDFFRMFGTAQRTRAIPKQKYVSRERGNGKEWHHARIACKG